MDFRIGGALCRRLFSRRGFTPHYAEHVEDPVTGSEVLVMADPHTRRSAFIYDLERGKIVWEHRVGGDTIKSNPHIARMVTEKLPALKAVPGDIICADMDNRFTVVDRVTGSVKWSMRPDDARWSHDAMPTSDGEGLIITDYSAGYVRRVRVDGGVVWSRSFGPGVAKLSRIGGFTPSRIHSNSYGGDILVAVNQSFSGVYELDEETGEIAWSCPPLDSTRNVTFTLKPHAAIRTGLAELGGNLTVFNQEAGGGLLAVDRDCRPRWGIVKPFTIVGGAELYRPSALGLYETTHVFEMLDGSIGFIDWGGSASSSVYQLLEIPRSGRFFWVLAWGRRAGLEPEYLDPPIETAEWSETRIVCRNEGGGLLALDLYATYSILADTDNGKLWRHISTLEIESGGWGEAILDGYSAVRLSAKASDETRYSIYVSQRA
ncbi:hypothetical protein HRbin01_00733 [archaeon HR01]|nr:hypothetical protein HRbin01_00733 [archaeon HR01]